MLEAQRCPIMIKAPFLFLINIFIFFLNDFYFRTLLNSPILRRKKSSFDSSDEDITDIHHRLYLKGTVYVILRISSDPQSMNYIFTFSRQVTLTVPLNITTFFHQNNKNFSYLFINKKYAKIH